MPKKVHSGAGEGLISLGSANNDLSAALCTVALVVVAVVAVVEVAGW